MTLALGFIGFGEVGQLFARQLAARADVSVAVYDILLEHPASRAELEGRAAASDVRSAATVADLCASSRIVISAVTPDQAVAAARNAAPHLTADHVYVDLNSVSPTTKRQVADVVAREGTTLVEFAVMAPVSGVGVAVPILAGGAAAAELAATLNPLGMNITVVSPEVGVASATKLCRSIVIKGMEALMIDLSMAGQKAGVLPAVLESLSASYPGLDWPEILRVMPSRVRRHGIRRAAEMREVSRMMGELGLDGSLAQAIAVRQETFADDGAAAPAEHEDGQPVHVA